MRDDLLTYYERELAFVRQMGAEFAQKYHLPVEPTRGGAATAYPEYAKTMKAPARETRP